MIRLDDNDHVCQRANHKTDDTAVSVPGNAYKHYAYAMLCCATCGTGIVACICMQTKHTQIHTRKYTQGQRQTH